MHLNTGNCTPGNSLVSFVFGDITPGTLPSCFTLFLGPWTSWPAVSLGVPHCDPGSALALCVWPLCAGYTASSPLVYTSFGGGRGGGYIISVASCRRCLDYISGSFSLSLFPLSSFLSFCFVLYIFMLEAIPICQLILGDYRFLRRGV